MAVRLNLRAKLILTILPISLLPVAMFAFLAYQHAKTVTSMIISHKGSALSYSASFTMHRLDGFLKDNLENAEALTRTYEMIDILTDDVDARIANILIRSKNMYGIYSSLLCFNARGKIVAAADQSLIGTELPNDYGFKTAIQGKSIITDASSLLWPRGSFINISCPIKSGSVAELTGQENIGVLSLYIELEAVYSILDSMDIDDRPIRPTAYPCLIDKQGVILWAPDFAIEKTSPLSLDLIKTGLKSVDNVLQGETGYTLEMKQGRYALIGYASPQGLENLQGIGWSLLVMQELDEATAPITTLQRFVLFIGILEVLIVMIAAVFFSRRITLPIVKLNMAAKEIAAGHDTLATVKSHDEIGELAKTFNEMVSRLKESKKTLETYAEGLKVRGAQLEISQRELEEKIKEMERFHTFVVDRELRMAELKEELRRLKGGITNA